MPRRITIKLDDRILVIEDSRICVSGSPEICTVLPPGMQEAIIHYYWHEGKEVEIG